MGKIANRAQGSQLQQAAPQKSMQDLIKGQWHKIESVMPKHLSSERLYQLAVSAINTTPGLMECPPASILSCIMKCSALGMEPSAVDGLGRAYILPFYNGKTRSKEATFILGYKGMIDLARRSGEILDISARAVYEGDEFEWEFGLNETLRHKPSPTALHTPDKLTHVYMTCHFKDGGHYIDVMSKQEVDAIRKRSKAADRGPWVTDYEAMARKTVIRRAFPYLPVSIEAQTAAASDDTSGGYVEMLTGKPVIEAQEASEEPIEVEEVSEAPEQQGAPESGPDEPRVAVCANCGERYEMGDGESAESITFECCPSPKWQVR